MLCIEQNKAVEAIAEKLDRAGFPFVVMGNKDKLGPVSQQYMLKALCKSDPLMLELQRQRERLTAAYSAVKSALYDGNPFESSARHKQYRTRRANNLFGANPKEGSTHEYERTTFLHRDPWALAWRALRKHRYPHMAAALEFLREKLDKLNTAAVKLGQTSQQRILQRSRALLCTVASSSSAIRRLRKLDAKANNDDGPPGVQDNITTLIIDEAGTCPEACLPLAVSTFPELKRIIAIGDHKQLPAFSHIHEDPWGKDATCHDYRFFGKCQRTRCRFKHVAEQGFFHRLAACLGNSAIHTLYTQYRMHPKICDLVSASSYDGKLKCDLETARDRKRGCKQALYWLDTRLAAPEEPASEGKSKCNPGEVEAVVQVLTKMRKELGDNFASVSIKVITFYKEQRYQIAKRLKSKGFRVLCSRTAKRRTREELEDPRNTHLQVMTVDEAQGSEADVVILSCVRSNHSGDVGFLTTRNRINVAISRARYRMIIVGCHRTLAPPSKRGPWNQIGRACKRVHKASQLPSYGSLCDAVTARSTAVTHKPSNSLADAMQQLLLDL